MTLIRILASREVAAMRYSCTRQLKLQYRITYTKKGTGLRIRHNNKFYFRADASSCAALK